MVEFTRLTQQAIDQEQLPPFCALPTFGKPDLMDTELRLLNLSNKTRMALLRTTETPLTDSYKEWCSKESLEFQAFRIRDLDAVDDKSLLKNTWAFGPICLLELRTAIDRFKQQYFADLFNI